MEKTYAPKEERRSLTADPNVKAETTTKPSTIKLG